MDEDWMTKRTSASRLAGLVTCGMALAGCGSSGDDSAPAASASISASESSTSVSSAPSVVLTDPGNVAGAAGVALADDTKACHVFLDELQIGTVPSTYLDAIILSLSFPNGTGAEAVDTYKQTIQRAQATQSSATLTADIAAMSSYMDSYGTPAQAGPATIRATADSIRATCATVGVLPAN